MAALWFLRSSIRVGVLSLVPWDVFPLFPYSLKPLGDLRKCTIDLFSLYILFFHFRPRDATRGNSFFQMSSYARANLRITNEKTKGKFPWGHHVVWSGKTKCTSWKGLLCAVIDYPCNNQIYLLIQLILDPVKGDEARERDGQSLLFFHTLPISLALNLTFHFVSSLRSRTSLSKSRNNIFRSDNDILKRF